MGRLFMERNFKFKLDKIQAWLYLEFFENRRPGSQEDEVEIYRVYKSMSQFQGGMLLHQIILSRTNKPNQTTKPKPNQKSNQNNNNQKQTRKTKPKKKKKENKAQPSQQTDFQRFSRTLENMTQRFLGYLRNSGNRSMHFWDMFIYTISLLRNLLRCSGFF